MTATKLDLVKVEDWGLFTDTTKPIIIAGPCSAESEQQVFETAKGLKRIRFCLHLPAENSL